MDPAREHVRVKVGLLLSQAPARGQAGDVHPAMADAGSLHVLDHLEHRIGPALAPAVLRRSKKPKTRLLLELVWLRISWPSPLVEHCCQAGVLLVLRRLRVGQQGDHQQG